MGTSKVIENYNLKSNQNLPCMDQQLESKAHHLGVVLHYLIIEKNH